MDQFEELINQLNDLSENDKEEEIKKLQKDCVCPICPTYDQCAKDKSEIIFCITGKSSCIEQEKGCMCPTCPFASKYKIGVLHNFYCIRGRDLEQRKLG
ncbi:MAG: DUF2769 domain-containing protein [Methanobacterium sp.]|nr:DUF2769 domain-containing protein [Methanobacterium sp.]